MKAVVLVGGEGTRLRPLTYDLPKPMVPICGKPFAQYQMELIKKHGINEVIFSLGYKWNSFEDYFKEGSNLGMKIHYVVEESPLGTAGAIKNVEDYIDNDAFLVFNGDILSEMDLTDIINFHKQKKSKSTIVLTPVDNPCIYGVVELDENQRIEMFTEKPKPEDVRSNQINAGLYVLEPEILNRMERGVNYSIERQIFPAMLEEGEPMYGYKYPDYWMDIGNPFKYLSANQDMLLGKMKHNPGLVNGIHKGKNVTIADGVTLEKPVWIGDDVIIKEGAKIIGPAVINKGCKIGESTTVEKALLWENTELGSGCSLNSCLVGRGCKVGDGVSIGELAVIGSGVTIEDGTCIESGGKV
ncbi:MAG: NDP-sugar synthase [Candidatus Eremiobacteraeota bacterium]|nr:NDP-sugar synthase [Candidatus Eremiobacteraeota bacterium]